MITLTAKSKIYICLSQIDFRCGIDGLGRICRDHLEKDPMEGSFFVFKNRKNTTLKILAYDGLAFWLFIRRLSSGKLPWWPCCSEITYKELQLLILGGNPSVLTFSQDWRKVI